MAFCVECIVFSNPSTRTTVTYWFHLPCVFTYFFTFHKYRFLKFWELEINLSQVDEHWSWSRKVLWQFVASGLSIKFFFVKCFKCLARIASIGCCTGRLRINLFHFIFLFSTVRELGIVTSHAIISCTCTRLNLELH